MQDDGKQALADIQRTAHLPSVIETYVKFRLCQIADFRESENFLRSFSSDPTSQHSNLYLFADFPRIAKLYFIV